MKDECRKYKWETLSAKQKWWNLLLRHTKIKTDSYTSNMLSSPESDLLQICSGLCMCVLSCLTLCDPTDYSQPDSSVHGILWARALEWVAISSSRGSSQTRDGTHAWQADASPSEPS